MDKKTRRWNKKVQGIISRKNKKFKEWKLIKSVEGRLVYIKAKREAKRLESKANASKFKNCVAGQRYKRGNK